MPTALQPRRIALAAVLLTGLAIRLWFGPLSGRQPDGGLGDQREYLESARNLLSGRGLGFDDPRFGQQVRAYRMPGYPLFLAACGASVPAAQTAQAAVDTATALGVYLLARVWLPGGWAALAAGLTALNPFLVYMSSLILSETLCAALLVWGVVLLLRANSMLWGAGVLAVSVLVRPSMLGLAPLLCMAVAVLRRRGAPALPARAGAATVLWRAPGVVSLALVLAALFPWALRNRLVLGQWIWLTTNGGITRYDGFHPHATGASDQGFVSRAEMSYLRLLDEVQRDRHLAALAGRHIAEAWRTRKGWLLRLTAAKIGRTWSPIPLSAEYGRRRLYVVAAAAWSVPTMVLSLSGALLAMRRNGGLPLAAALVMLLPAAYVTLIHAMSVGSLRYRVPVEPFLAVLAAWGAAALFRLCAAFRDGGDKPRCGA